VVVGPANDPATRDNIAAAGGPGSGPDASQTKDASFDSILDRSIWRKWRLDPSVKAINKVFRYDELVVALSRTTRRRQEQQRHRMRFCNSRHELGCKRLIQTMNRTDRHQKGGPSNTIHDR
jgi:hypothetical protein